MKKLYCILSLLLLSAFASVNAQTTVFTDNFDRSSFTSGSTGGIPSTTYTFVLGATNPGSINTVLVGGSNYMVNLSSGTGAGANAKDYFWAPMNVYSSPWNLTLSTMTPGIVTWTFNMRTSNAVTTVPTQNAMGGGVDLCGNAAGNIYNGSPTGYGVIFNSGATGGVSLVKFSGGLNASTAIITQTTTVPKTDYYSVRVTYNSATNAWALYVRDDGAGAFADPSSGVTLQQGSTVTDATYTSQAMTNFGVIYTYTAGAGKTMSVDNYTVIVTIPPCSGTPTAGTVSASVSNGCGLSYNSNLSLSGSTIATGLTYQWQSSADNISWTNVGGATNTTYTASVTTNIYYRCQVTCTNSLTTASTAGIYLSILVPKFAVIPFNEGFESSWANGCGTADQPDSNWINAVPTGNRSWRRSDDFSTAGWTYGSSGIYSPTSSQGSYSADFDSYSVASGNSGALSLYIKLPAGNKQISYDYINIDGTDALICQLSTDGGATYNTIDVPPVNAAVWTTRTVTTTSVSPTCIIRFVATSDFGATNIGLDNVNVCLLPNPVITGNPAFCFGGSTVLSDSVSGGVWSSSSTAIANVGSGTGVVTSVSPGTINIAYNNGCGTPIIQTVTVNPLPSAIGGSTNVCLGIPDTLIDDAGGNWTTGNTTIATVTSVTSGTGVVSGVSFGTTTITYTFPTGCSTFTTVTVNPSPSPISSTTGSMSVCAGLTDLLTDGGSGTWTSSNPGLASVDINFGIVTGLVAGNPVITYAFATGCRSIATITVNPLPAAITGATSVCYLLSTTLNDATPGGTWSSSVPGNASIDPTGIVTGASSSGGSTNINYTLSTGCLSTLVFADNPLPTPYTVSASAASYCPGMTAPDIQMAPSAVGVNYQLSYNGVPITTDVLSGTGSMLDFSTHTTAGTYTVIATDATTGCVQTMTGSPVISILPAPAIHVLEASNGGNYCVGSAGTDIFIDTSEDITVTYQLFGGGTSYIGIGVAGSSADFNGGPVTYTPGVYTATATNSAGCSSNMTGSITVTENALPNIYNVTVTAGGFYCAGGSGVHVGLNNSSTGVNYYLYNSGSLFPIDSLPGSNSGIDFGYQTAGGTYSIVAVNAVTGCTNNMNGNPIVTVNPLPTSVYAVSEAGSGNYCPGGTGVDIQLSQSDNFVSYQLLVGGAIVDTLVPGNGSMIDFGPQTVTGVYTVIGIDQVTGCTAKMTDSAVVNTYAPLSVYTLNGGAGSYCAGDPGVHFAITNSTLGVSYKLYNGTTMIDSAAGLGFSLDFGLQTLAGTYRVVAIDPFTGCTANMAGSPTLAMNSLPVAYPVSVDNSGNFCAGGKGVDIGLGFSDVGINYQLWRGVTMVGSAKGGSSSALDFGTFTTPGTYTVTGTNAITTCSITMNGSPTVTSKPLPTAYAVTGGGSFCVGGAGKHVGLAASNAGINYQLYNGTTAGITLAGTGSSLDFGSQTITGSYSVVAMDTLTQCTQNMSGSVVVTTNLPPTVYNVTNGGSFCAGGTGVHVGLSGSTPGIQYHLMDGIIPAGVVTGTGSALDFGLKTVGGTYTVVADNVTSSCSSNMNDSAIVTINSLPTPYTVTGGGPYCAGSGGADITLNGSEPGVNYQVYMGSTPAGGTVVGTGMILDLGLQKGAGTYTVIGANAATGCSMNMTGSTTVTVNAVPDIYTVTGSGHFCAGGTGVPVYLSGSHTGISYQLYNGTSLAGKAVTGTGAALSFGPQTTNGAYTAVATNTATGCSSNMMGSGNVTIDPVPDAFTISGGGHFCAGTTGVAVGLTGSVSGINYQLYNGTTPTGLPVGGTGAAITFGLQTIAGTAYTVVGTNTTTKCTNNMTGSTSVTADPVVTPSVSIATSTGDNIACIGAATTFTAIPANGGTAPMYEWSVNGLPMAGTNAYSYIASDGDIVSVQLTSDANCVTTTIANKSLTMSVIPYQTPAANITVTPGDNVCHGTTVSFAATTDFGGSAAGYMWLKNSIPMGTGTSYSYTPGTANNGDVIIFRLMSDYRCRTINTDTIFSNAIVMTVDSAETPAFTIGSHLGKVIGVGRVDTFTATLTGPTKGAISYQWMINSMPVPGATSALYIDYNVFDNDLISCSVTRSGACGNEVASQNVTVVNLTNVGVQQISGAGSEITVLPNPNKGTFTVKGTLGVAGDEEVSLEITNMLGQVVYKTNVTAHNGNLDEQIQLNKVANGMYLLSLHSGVVNNVYHIVVEQ